MYFSFYHDVGMTEKKNMQQNSLPGEYQCPKVF